MTLVRILLAVVAVLVLVAGCGSGAEVKDGARLRFRPVLGELPSGVAVGPPGLRQSTDPATQDAAARALVCPPGKPDALDGQDDPALPLVTCERLQGNRYLLGPGFLSGADVGSVEAGLDGRTGRGVVEVAFTDSGAKKWADWTGHHIGKKFAVVLKSQVISTVTIYAVITDGMMQFTGNFTAAQARQLVREITVG
jgi:preprotein translocase subunit SecD